MILPTIVDDDDFVLCESKAILMYLPHKEKGCRSQSYPKCPKVRALVNQRLLFDSVDFYPRVNEVANLMYSPEPIITVQHKAKITKALQTMETFLDGHDYFVGNKPTIADFAFCSSVALLIAMGFEIEISPKVAAWFERMKLLKGFDQMQAGAQQYGDMIKGKLKNSFADF
jgi:glutathione S-transferase